MLQDNLTKESVHRIHEAFMEGVLEIDRTKAGDLKFNKRSFERVGVPVARFVHAKLWESGRDNNTGKFIDFPRVTDVSLDGVLSKEGVTHKNGGRATLGSDIARVLQHAGIALYRRPLWYLKPFNEDKVEWATHADVATKNDPKVEKRIEEFLDMPVTTTIDLRSIKRPEVYTPESVAEFVEKFVPAALKVQDLLVEALQTLADHVGKEEEKKAKAWEGVGSKIEEALNGNK